MTARSKRNIYKRWAVVQLHPLSLIRHSHSKEKAATYMAEQLMLGHINNAAVMRVGEYYKLRKGS